MSQELASRYVNIRGRGTEQGRPVTRSDANQRRNRWSLSKKGRTRESSSSVRSGGLRRRASIPPTQHHCVQRPCQCVWWRRVCGCGHKLLYSPPVSVVCSRSVGHPPAAAPHLSLVLHQARRRRGCGLPPARLRAGRRAAARASPCTHSPLRGYSLRVYERDHPDRASQSARRAGSASGSSRGVPEGRLALSFDVWRGSPRFGRRRARWRQRIGWLVGRPWRLRVRKRLGHVHDTRPSAAPLNPTSVDLPGTGGQIRLGDADLSRSSTSHQRRGKR